MDRWNVAKKSVFSRQYKNIGSLRQFRVDQAVEDLTASDQPMDMGVYKKSIRAFAYNVSKSDRLIYRVDHVRRQIVLMRVCDHKSVYGRG